MCFEAVKSCWMRYPNLMPPLCCRGRNAQWTGAMRRRKGSLADNRVRKQSDHGLTFLRAGSVAHVHSTPAACVGITRVDCTIVSTPLAIHGVRVLLIVVWV
ncbi:hypothetical protein, unlikely [Trypanosoma congolense IL3000]|uniref:Uncharacterized protein n=1 Tax=Trypanosoma congolense (strain IL3000) TaxID=1068625 RepID=F9WDG1_TRYCI|nr:hypothetical protein, unlikely [Trypanosoma congolense IL3000]